MKQLGLIGNPISHSQSPALFQSFFKQFPLEKWSYDLFPLNDAIEIHELIQNHPDLCGLNVTIPFKKQVLSLLHSLDVTASATQAVNTISIDRKGPEAILTGYNTDIYGFENSLNAFGNFSNCQALILGNGGASLAVQFVLKKMNIPFLIVSRNSSEYALDYGALLPELVHQSELIINTTPLGMWPQIDSKPELPYSAISSRHFCFDLVYNPAQTLFLQKAAAKGSITVNGYSMLQLQADKSWEIWNS